MMNLNHSPITRLSVQTIPQTIFQDDPLESICDTRPALVRVALMGVFQQNIRIIVSVRMDEA